MFHFFLFFLTHWSSFFFFLFRFSLLLYYYFFSQRSSWSILFFIFFSSISFLKLNKPRYRFHLRWPMRSAFSMNFLLLYVFSPIFAFSSSCFFFVFTFVFFPLWISKWITQFKPKLRLIFSFLILHFWKNITYMNKCRFHCQSYLFIHYIISLINIVFREEQNFGE